MASYEQILQKKISSLGGIYSEVLQKIRKQLENAKTFDYAEKQEILRGITGSLEELDSKVKRWIDKEIPKEYKIASKDAPKFIKSVSEPIKYSFNQLDEEAIRALIDETTHLLAEGNASVFRSVTRILDHATRLRVQYKMIEGKISGASLKTLKDTIAGEIARSGISIVDKAGRKWGAGRYAEMVARTKNVESANNGMMNQLIKNDFDLVQVTDHSGECPLCRPFERTILSITGNTTSYKGEPIKSVEQARAEGLFHPNCKHRLVPFHPEFAEESLVWSEGRYKLPK